MKNFRSANLGIILAYSILFVSCSNGDSSTISNTSSVTNEMTARTTQDLLEQNKILWADAQKKYGSAGFELTTEELTLNDNDYETNWAKAVGTGLISESEKPMFEKLGDDLVAVGFTTAISSFETAYKAKGYTGTKLSVYENIVKSLQQTNTIDPTFFSRNNFDCGLAVVSFVGAFIGLATLTAATSGLLVGVAVVGYCGASVSLVRSCRK